MPGTVNLRVANTHKPPELPAGQPKLQSTDIAKEVSKRWNAMDPETKVAVTDPLMKDLVASREEADTKAKITPVHVLNDVSATMAKINREVRLQKHIHDFYFDVPFPLAGRVACPHRLRDHHVRRAVKC